MSVRTSSLSYFVNSEKYKKNLKFLQDEQAETVDALEVKEEPEVELEDQEEETFY